MSWSDEQVILSRQLVNVQWYPLISGQCLQHINITELTFKKRDDISSGTGEIVREKEDMLVGSKENFEYEDNFI